MILLYTLLLVALATVVWVVRQRAASLERHYVAKSQAMQRALSPPMLLPGNKSQPDLAHVSKRHYLIGQLALERDQLEGRYLTWQHRADRLSGWLQAARAWKGKKLPYTLGALDVSLVLYLIDHLGVGQVMSARALIQTILAWLQG